MKKENKRDWIVHVVPDVYDNSPLLEGMINYHTHGLEEYGLTNLSVIMDNTYSTEIIGNFINTVADMMVDGEVFSKDFIHSFDSEFPFLFKMYETTCFGEKTIRLILSDKKKEFPDLGDSRLAVQASDLFLTFEK